MKFRVGLNWDAYSEGARKNLTVLVLNAITLDKNGNCLRTIKCPALGNSTKKPDK